ncbi:MAG: hypothetical protein HY319_25270 [Armatimonadetes bacterium]|nr:hypothetical protein [Armatimonadota bacterium]
MDSADNPFLRTFGEGWGIDYEEPAEDQPTTVRGLIRMLERRAQGLAEAEAVSLALEQVAQEVRTARDASTADLEKAQVLDPRLRSAAEDTIEAYSALLEVLEWAASPEGGQPAEAAEELTTIADALTERLEIVRSWERRGELVCPRCGWRAEQGTELDCAHCGSHTVIPDPNPPDFPRVRLGGRYLAIYRACEAAATGRGPLSLLDQALESLEGELRRAKALIARAGEGLEPTEAALQDSLDAMERMRSFLDTRALSELNQGWLRLSEAALELRRLQASVET